MTYRLVDVREPHEHEISRIPGSMLIPLGDLASRLDELDRAETIVIHCQTGRRSLEACRILRENGFENAFSLKGGIVEWMRQSEPTLAAGDRPDHQ
jgi:adenylyltransferase/sulfurtransferase